MTNTEKIGFVKDWHDPRNEDCQHNGDVALDCKCKRAIKRKPYRVIRVTDNGVAHNVNPKLVMEVWPKNGTITVREHGRRKKYSTTTADLYSLLVRWAANAEVAKRKKARAEKRMRRRDRAPQCQSAQ
jgi:hypothetical protein